MKDKVLARAIKQKKMFGYLIPRNYMEAIPFVYENKSIKWYDAIKLEMKSMLEYSIQKVG